MKNTIAVIMACYNRVHTTLKCLSHLYSQNTNDEIKIIVYLVDDGSTDGTSQIIHEKYPDIVISHGNGNLFWNRGMYMAFSNAIEKVHDYYLWLNDDTMLYENALHTLITTHKSLMKIRPNPCIIVGSTQDPVSKKFTYGGYVRNSKINPLGLKLRKPRIDSPYLCETFCGNCVLIPHDVVQRVGNMNYAYSHRWGDVDYGLRAKHKQCESWVAPGYLATCADNPNADLWKKRELSFRQKIKELHSIKGIGKKDWYMFVRLHGGMLWPIIWVRPYINIVVSSIKHTLGVKGAI